MENAQAADGSAFAQIYVESLSLRNYRGIAECVLELEPRVTLLVGRNNAGKSRILRALGIALFGIIVELDDLTVGSQAPASIDVIIAPPPPTEDGQEEAFDKAVGQRFGAAVQATREEPLRERVAWRTTITRSAEGMGARADAHWLVYDAGQEEWVLPSNAPGVSRDARQLVAAALVDTRRDVVEELGRRGSSIRRVLSDLEVDEQQRNTLEQTLAGVSASIVGASATLGAVKAALEELERAIGEIGVPALNPLPARLEELARSVSIELDTGSGALPVRLHGSGARSLASLQIQSVLYSRRLGQDGPVVRPHPVTLVEEPEAHLHPQASMELSDLLAELTGQVVASTHSAQLVTTAEPRAVRLIRTEGPAMTVIDLGPRREEGSHVHRALRASTHASEMEKLKRLVERPFGELLFASAIVIGDGATERALLPVALRHALGGKTHGLCVIDPGSMGSPLATAAVKFAQLVGIPWLLFADSDGPGREAAMGLVNTYGDGDTTLIVWVTGDHGDAGGASEKMMIGFDEAICREACLELRPDLDPAKSTLELMKALKGAAGALLGRKLVEKHSDASTWPAALRELVEKLTARLGG